MTARRAGSTAAEFGDVLAAVGLRFPTFVLEPAPPTTLTPGTSSELRASGFEDIAGNVTPDIAIPFST